MVGLYLHRSKAPYAIRNGSIAGALVVLAAVVAGRFVPGTALGALFTLSKPQITIAIAIYGFIASVLPVWMLLCPRDYLSSYMKLGTIAALVIGTIVVAPHIYAPARLAVRERRRPDHPRQALSVRLHHHRLRRDLRLPRADRLGHDAEDDRQGDRDARMIGYGAMLCEGLVGCVALIAVCALHPGDYFAINVAARGLREARPVDREPAALLERWSARRWSAAPAARSRWPSASRRSSPASRSSAA